MRILLTTGDKNYKKFTLKEVRDNMKRGFANPANFTMELWNAYRKSTKQKVSDNMEDIQYQGLLLNPISSAMMAGYRKTRWSLEDLSLEQPSMILLACFTPMSQAQASVLEQTEADYVVNDNLN